MGDGGSRMGRQAKYGGMAWHGMARSCDRGVGKASFEIQSRVSVGITWRAIDWVFSS